MTDYETMVAEAERISERIGRAPVEPWLKTEALADLESLLLAARKVIQRLSEEQFREQANEEKHSEEKDVTELATPAPVDFSWQRLQVVEALLRGGVHPAWLLSTAREVQEWVSNG